MPQRAPANPTLPQNDTPAQRAARAAQLAAAQATWQWTTAVPSLPAVPVASAVPAADEPTLTWWLLLVDIGLKIARNHLAVKQLLVDQGLLALTPAAIAADSLACDAIEAALAVTRQKMGHPAGATLWDIIKREVHLGVEAVVEEVEIATLKDHSAKLFSIVTLSDADVAALGTDTPRSIDTYRELFQTLALPGIGWTFQEDSEFARLRVAGPNCMLLRGIDALPANFPLDAQTYAGVVNGDSLATALAEGRLYLNDYAELAMLVPGSWKGRAKFVYRPMALFAVPPGGTTLVPVAIQCDQDPGENPIFTPSCHADRAWGWEVAKLIVQVADGNYHELFTHLARTHLVIEAVAVATHRHLSDQHPLWALLVPHCEGTLFINNAAATSLITPGGPIDHIFGGTIASSQQAAADARFAFDFTAKMLPADLRARKVDDPSRLPDYPYRDDALLVWQAIHGWTRGYVDLYYADDAAVTGDTELAAWSATLIGEGQIKGFAAPATRQALVDALTMILFTASAQHAAVNFPQKAIMEFAPAVTGAGWEDTPQQCGGFDKAGWLDYMPPKALALEQLETLNLLGSLYYRPLGTYLSPDFPYPDWFQDPQVTGPEGPLARFRAALQDVEARIVARNAVRRHAYTFLQPSLIPSSINI